MGERSRTEEDLVLSVEPGEPRLSDIDPPSTWEQGVARLGRLATQWNVARVLAVLVVLCGAIGIGLSLAWPQAPVEPDLEQIPMVDASSPALSPSASASATNPIAPETVYVHVAGAVQRPGVHSLRADARVVDAVQAAGGALPEADLDQLNLAAPVVDGLRVFVPKAGESDPAPASTPSGLASTPSGPVDLNRATGAELDLLPGIGPATAAAILGHRDENGPFGSVEELLDVTGIGPAKLAALEGLVTVG